MACIKFFFLIVVFLLSVGDISCLYGDNFFEIKYLRRANRDEFNKGGIYKEIIEGETMKDVIVPSVEVGLTAKQLIRSDKTILKAYFFDENGRLLAKGDPGIARRNYPDRDAYSIPVFFSNQAERVFFPIPETILKKKWTALVVFGDKYEVVTKRDPDGGILELDFAERKLALSNKALNPSRPPDVDPVKVLKVKTLSKKHPELTLMLRFPEGINDGSQIKGVLAMCVLANSIGDIKRRLQMTGRTDYHNMVKYADERKLAIVCWGSRTIWRPGASYDELERETNFQIDAEFDKVAAAWERGVKELVNTYALPEKGYLIWGLCGGAQWAHRLALSKPEYFLAINIHIPSSFAEPTPRARKILWLLTSGELDGGYHRCIRFFNACKKEGYPIIFKPITNLGHAASPIADGLGIRFFDYALSTRQNFDVTSGESRQGDKGLPIGFEQPPYIGDFMNQAAVPYRDRRKVPLPFQVPLPTKEIYEAWIK